MGGTLLAGKGDPKPQNRIKEHLESVKSPKGWGGGTLNVRSYRRRQGARSRIKEVGGITHRDVSGNSTSLIAQGERRERGGSIKFAVQKKRPKEMERWGEGDRETIKIKTKGLRWTREVEAAKKVGEIALGGEWARGGCSGGGWGRWAGKTEKG